MPYTKTTWVDNSAPDIDAANLNNIEDGISKAPYGPDASANNVPVWNGSAWVYEQIADAQVSASAAIAYSKLALASAIKNADIATAAGIVYTKLNLSGAIQDSDILSTANLHKLAGVTGTPNGTKFLRDDGSWEAVSGGGTSLDYAQVTTPSASITASTEGTAVSLITGNSITYDGTKVRIEFFFPSVATSGSQGVWWYGVVLRDSTVVGHVGGAVVRGADATDNNSWIGVVYDTPAAGAHTYKLSVYVQSSATIVFNAGAGGSGNLVPAYLSVTKA